MFLGGVVFFKLLIQGRFCVTLWRCHNAGFMQTKCIFVDCSSAGHIAIKDANVNFATNHDKKVRKRDETRQMSTKCRFAMLFILQNVILQNATNCRCKCSQHWRSSGQRECRYVSEGNRCRLGVQRWFSNEKCRTLWVKAPFVRTPFGDAQIIIL